MRLSSLRPRLAGVPGVPGGVGGVGGTLMRLGIAAGLALTGYLHADLYAHHGYHSLHVIGPMFAWLAGASFALAALFVVAVAVPEPLLLRLAAACLVAGALVGFVLSRTVGLFGFLERGLQPAPQAVLSLVAESAVLLLAGGGFAGGVVARGGHHAAPSD